MNGSDDARQDTSNDGRSRHDAGDGSVGDAGVRVGDFIDGNEVISVSLDFDGCATVQTQEPKAAFECTEAQLAALGAADSNPGSALPAAGGGALATSTCAELENRRRGLLLQSLSGALQQNYLSQLAEYCLPATHTIHLRDGVEVGYCTPGADAGVVAEYPTLSEPNEGASDYSTTNTQVADVDEADYVKNDGQTIYVLTDRSLVVFDAWPVEDLAEIARVPLPAVPRRMFLGEGRLIVYLNEDSEESEATCTYGYGCRSSSESGTTLVQVYDVSKPAMPTLLEEYAFSGSYLASRRIGDAVFTLVHDRGPEAPANADVRIDASTPDGLDKQYATKLTALTELVDAMPSEQFLPTVSHGQPGQPKVHKAMCDAVLATGPARGTSFVSVAGFDLGTLGEPSSTVIATKPGFVYASTQSLYLAVDGVDGQDDTFSSPWAYADPEEDRSTIYKFALDGIEASYRGSEVIPGHVLNQFSMDEHEGVLRVATTNGWVPASNVSSNVTTLGEQNEELTVLGELRELAPNEDIRSVRFDGNRGFIVTFKKTDPLFVIGLADAAKPTVLGELKIPGFSTYMHLLDEDHLLAVGFDADDHGDFAYFDGIQVQIFDVSDLGAPKLQHKAVIGTRGSGSEALMNHLAFNYFPSRSALALPATVCAGGDDGQFGDNLEFSGLIVFDVSLENGLTERGRLPFATTADVLAQPSGSCGAWWTDASSLVKRSIFLDDYAIGLSDEWLKAGALSDLGTVLRSLPLGD